MRWLSRIFNSNSCVYQTARLPANVKKLVCYWVRLKTADNILYRESEENLQLLLPSNLHKLIYEELDSKTG